MVDGGSSLHNAFGKSSISREDWTWNYL